MNNKPGFIPIIIAVVIAAAIVGGTTYGITSSKMNKIIKDQEVKINQLSQDLEDLKTQLSSEELSLPEEIKETLSVPSTPSTPKPSVPSKPSTPTAQPTTPAAPQSKPTPTAPVPAAPANNAVTWSGKICNIPDGQQYSLSFQYPKDVELSDYSNKCDKTSYGGYISIHDTISFYTIAPNFMFPFTEEAIKEQCNNLDMSTVMTDEGVKWTTIGGKQAAQCETWSRDNLYRTAAKRPHFFIKLGENAILYGSSYDRIRTGSYATDYDKKLLENYNQVLSSMKF